MNFKFAFATDVGRKRVQNQDSGGVFPDSGLFLVADGMGGHQGGETASKTAVEEISSTVAAELQKKTLPAEETLVRAIESANQKIFEMSEKTPTLRGMGTTTTALLFNNSRLTIGHVGDSRCYYIRSSCIWQATRDHSLVQEKLRAGLITREAVKTDRMKNVITRSVGYEKNVDVETYHMDVRVGDCFLVCSDGLTGMVEDSKILEIIQKYLLKKDNIEEAVNQLIAEANNQGGDDNITSVLVQVIE